MMKDKIKFLMRFIWVIVVVVSSGFLFHSSVYATPVTPTPTPVPEGFHFKYASQDITEGSEITLTDNTAQFMVVRDDDAAFEGTDQVTWITSNEDIVGFDSTIPSVSKNIVTLKRNGPGYSTITAIITKSNGDFYTIVCQVKVPLEIVRTGLPIVDMNQNQVLDLDNVGDTKTLTLKYAASVASSVEWKSSDITVATVDIDGKVTAVGAGTATISVTTSTASIVGSFQSDTIKVVVSPLISLTPSAYTATLNIPNGATDFTLYTNSQRATNITWVVKDSNDTVISPTDTSKITYTPSPVSGNLEISNAKAGTYYIYGFASPLYNTGNNVDYILVTLTVPIQAPDTNIIMNVGDTYSIVNNSNIPEAAMFTYSITNAHKAFISVDSNTGVITAIKKGVGDVTMTCPDPTKYFDSAITTATYTTTVTVIDGISLSSSFANIYVAGSITLDAVTSNSAVPIVWTSSDPTIATVDKGVVKGIKASETPVIITATQVIAGVTKNASCTIYVQESVTKITLDPSEVILDVLEYKTLFASITPTGLNNVTLKWVSSDPSVVVLSDEGEVSATIQGLSGGTAIISAINQENIVIGSCRVSVKEKVTGISLSESSVSLSLASKTLQLRATITPKTALNQDVIWTSTNSTVASVDENGLVTLKASGLASIIATSEDNPLQTAICNITVKVPISSLTIDETTKAMYVGETTRLGYVILPSTTTDKDVSWSSTNTTIATVDSSGLVSAKGVGVAIIILRTADGSYYKTCTITVGQKATGITLDVSDLEVEIGKSYTITTKVTPADSTEVSLTWTSTDTKIATVDQKGKVTGVSAGKTVIIAKTPIGTTVYCNVTVIQPATGIQLNFTEKTIVLGENFKIKATVVPSAAAEDVDLTWTTSNAKVAKVSTAGTVTSVSGGTAIITCKTADGKFTTFCIVHVVERVTSVTLNKSTYKIGVGKNYTLKATIKSNAATNPTVKWTSSNTKVATVNSKGKVTGKSLGYAIITATAQDGSGADDSCEIRIIKPVTSIKLNKSSVTTIEGRSFTLKATVSPSNSTYKTVKWTTSDENIAIVGSNGVVTTLAEGKVTITATAKDGTGKKATCFVMVRALTPATSVTILNEELTMVVGETTTLQKAISPATSTDRFTWQSDNKTVASVDKSTGKVTARTPGTASITVMTESGKTATAKVTVVGLNITNLELEQYTVYQLEVIGITSGVTWDIADNNIATVVNGKVTSKRTGTTTITATVNGRKLTCRLKVVKIK